MWLEGRNRKGEEPEKEEFQRVVRGILEKERKGKAKHTLFLVVAKLNED